jgi:ABC-type spermidine/putrescine transport system permease subunit II
MMKRIIEAAVFVLLFFAVFGPITGMVLWSIAMAWYWPHTLPQSIGLDYWLQVLGIQRSGLLGAVTIVDSFYLSIVIALTVVALAMLIAIPAGYVLAKYSIPMRGAILLLFLMPQAFPQQPIFINLMLTFYRWNIAGTIPGVVLAHLMASLVYAIWICSAAFKSVSPDLEEAARSVGASRLRSFLHITLPLAAAGIIASSVFVFLYSLDEFTGTFFIGLPFITTLPMLLYSASGFNMQFASATAIVLLIPSIAFMIVIERFLKGEYLSGMGV